MGEIVYLESGRKVVRSAAAWLAGRLRVTPSGAKSLAHLLVVVPTAQSGRRLRRVLAEEAGALVPPRLVMPAEIVLPEETDDLAGRTDELVAFVEALGTDGSLDVAAQYVDLRAQLGANALSFADVAARVEAILPSEIVDCELARWQKLAELETRYHAALARRGKRDRIAAMQEYVVDPPKLSGVEEIVLACVLDPLPAMRRVVEAMGLPVTELLPRPSESPWLPLSRDQILVSGTAVSESARFAEMVASVPETDALPAICLADASMFPELQAAFQAKEIAVHNPAKMDLATSSLGHLVGQLAALVRTSSYKVFSAFIRGGDARRWLQTELSLTDDAFAGAIKTLDELQARLLPEKIADIAPKSDGDLRRIFDFVSAVCEKADIRSVLLALFKTRLLDEHDADAREFAAAADVVNELLTECFDETIPEKLRFELFARRLDESSYSLEPDAGDVVQTDGWLELPYLDADELIIAGFQEGCVPESIVGHAFLPDSLRKGLGLPSNESRAARDKEILRLALACRASEAVTIGIHSIDASGDVVRPSRLLFLCADVEDLIARVQTFYELRAGTAPTRAADLPDAWRLKLPIPPEFEALEHTSPSSLDAYLACPFTYFLKKTFGEKSDDRAEELEAREFGDLAHRALERWGRSEWKDSEDAAEIAAVLTDEVDHLLGERFGASVPAIVALQGESLKARLRHFAEIQVARRKEGWRIVALEESLTVRYGETTIHGRLDRIDRNEATGEWCVIDYKTWEADKPDLESVQLPLYVAMLDVSQKGTLAEATRARISSCYCVLGKTREQVLFSSRTDGASLPEAEAKIRELIVRIARGVFWPPSKKDLWQYDFKPFIFRTPEESVDAAWLADQQRRLADG